ncbi:hypothetical protein KQX54_014339 [Cotesia glomerata]|uniref:Uncharacterized protein n=1 Tax=Cotesia glomerata TaxID=32391 RepID=A0AAV7I0W7_COTGL|nr:hypothetical protein KQX54_014339 [Cotesia glomerata]
MSFLSHKLIPNVASSCLNLNSDNYDKQSDENVSFLVPQTQENILAEVLLPQLIPNVELQSSSESVINDVNPLQSNGRKKRRKRVNYTIRKRQLRQATLNYTHRNPDVHRKATKKYAYNNPHVSRAATTKYNEKRLQIKLMSWTLKFHFKSDNYDKQSDENVSFLVPQTQENILAEVLLPQLIPNVELQSSSESVINDVNPLQSNGRKKRRKRVNYTIRKRQLRQATLNYTHRNPDVHRKATKKYAYNNPHVSRAATTKYNEKRLQIKLMSWTLKALSGLSYEPSIDYQNDKIFKAKNLTIDMT